METRRTLILLYQYFYPDEVISARLYADIAEEMTARGWRVVAMPASRDCHGNKPLPLRDQWTGGEIRRIWRPGFKQSSFSGRILNATFMIGGWTWRALTFPRSHHEVMIVGTDPVFGVMAALPWRLLRRKTKIIHWCHDLHPEAIIADGGLRKDSLLVKALRIPLRWAYGCADLLVDLGDCMRAQLRRAAGDSSDSKHRTITPWALAEPQQIPNASPQTKQALFGAAKLGCLYSGNLGRAHEFETFVELARLLRAKAPEQCGFCFAGRGNRFAALRNELQGSDTNIRLADFASEDSLQDRLAAADVHLVSLRPNWTGTVVPSKFFGALAIGRPVLFAGSSDSVLAKWIKDYSIGWHLTSDSASLVAEQLAHYTADVDARRKMNEHCFTIYHKHFSRTCMMNRWDEILHRDLCD